MPQPSPDDLVALANVLPQMCWLADRTGSIYWYNDRWMQFTGLTQDEMLGWGWQRVHDPEHLDRVMSNFTRAIAAGTDWDDTFPLRRHDGVWRWFLSRARPSRDGDGQILRWVGTNTDVTESLQQQGQLRTEERRYRSLVDAVSQIVWRATPEGTLTGDTGPWQSFTGQTAAALSGLGWLDAIHPEDQDATLQAWQGALERRGFYQVEHRMTASA